VERARSWNVARGTYLVLRLAREVFATPVPQEALDALAPAEFDEKLLRIAMRGVIEESPAGKLRYTAGLAGKLRALKTLVLPDLDVLADVYNVNRRSPLVYGLYLRRALKVARRWREVVDVYRDGRVESESAAMNAFLHGAAK